jgi:predicted kinase
MSEDEPMYTNVNKETMYICRGPAGSGKSHLAKEIADRTGYVIASADNYWYLEDGTYRFRTQYLGVAHDWCQSLAHDEIQAGRGVVIDNTNITWKNIKPYCEMALPYRMDVRFVYPSWSPDLYDERGAWNIEFILGKSIHGVPQDVVKAMVNRFDWMVETKYALMKARYEATPRQS